MNTISRTITGGVFVVVGFILLSIAFAGYWSTVFYAVPILIIGFFILFNHREDEIEKRKDEKGGNKK